MKFRSIVWRIVSLSLVFIASLESRSDCLLTFTRGNEIRTCFASKCFEYRDPIALTSNSCRIQFLKLSFTNQETLLDFVDKQANSDSSLEELFEEDAQENNILEIEIDSDNSIANDHFLSLDMLSDLGGESENIPVFKLTIQSWPKSHSNVTKFIEEAILSQQPFREIHLTFFCHVNTAVVHWILYQEKDRQEQSPCPRQIQIRAQKDLHQQLEPWQSDEHFQPQDEQQKKKNHIPIMIVVIFVIVLASGSGFYYFVSVRRTSKRSPKNLANDNDEDTPASEIDQTDIV